MVTASKREPMKTLQEIFDIAVSRTLAQGRKSQESKPRPGRDSSMCLYRGPGGVCCPVGHVIPDSLYDKEIEGVAVCNIQSDIGLFSGKEAETKAQKLDEILRLSGVPKDAIPLLEDLQTVHDQEESPRNWPRSFRQVAGEYTLKATVIDEFVAGEA